ncbi:MAG: cation:proton antiporter [Candidatus Nitronauta litoralis]|uniref:Cation:proton antiporter n=1 Tax=Candidatus Nitronauta litoralis TaxID=2705533 RepID=A0A7T0G0Y4_9BACT|nr:MAG: cation:proton antiporter [Candidatus Nitronauta litoralis]
METISKTLITLGAIFLLGLAVEYIGRKTRLPRVTLLLVLGILIGPSALDVLPRLIYEEWFTFITDIALGMVGFLLGEKLLFSILKENAKTVLAISIGEVLVTSVLVFTGLFLIGVSVEMSLILAGIATATAPAATMDVVQETGAQGPFTTILLEIVAIDDAWGLIVFSFLLAMAHSLHTNAGGAAILLSGSWELGGALLLGIALGIPMAFLTGRLRFGEPMLIEALGFLFLCTGIALWMEVSFLLASIVMGAVVANMAQHHKYPFHAIKEIESPFLILFFLLAGASLQLESLGQVGTIGLVYIIFRVLGRISGAWIGGTLCDSPTEIKNWMGLALMPQAGVALGMALVANQEFPKYGVYIFPLIIGTTVFFELTGPILTRVALTRSGELLNKKNN